MAQNVIRWHDAYDYTAEMSEGPQRNYARTYYATLRHKNIDPFFIFDYSKCPKLGAGHQYDSAARCVRVRLSQVGTTAVWKAAVEWSTNITDPQNEPNPLDRPAVISTSTEIQDVPTLVDADGLPLINTAGDLQPGVTSKPFQVIKIQKNVAKIPDWWYELPGAVNKSAVTIRKKKYEPRTLKLMTTEEPDEVLENGKWFYPISFTLKRDYETWDALEVSRGFHELIPVYSGQVVNGQNRIVTSYQKKRITVGNPPEYPKEKQYLDINGRALTLTPGKNGGIDLTKIVIQRKRNLREADFKAIPLK